MLDMDLSCWSAHRALWRHFSSFLTISNWTQISIAACFLLTASADLLWS